MGVVSYAIAAIVVVWEQSDEVTPKVFFTIVLSVGLLIAFVSLFMVNSYYKKAKQMITCMPEQIGNVKKGQEDSVDERSAISGIGQHGREVRKEIVGHEVWARKFENAL